MSCKAITPSGPCKLLAADQSRYCEAHEMQQAKSLKTYKRLTREYLAFENRVLSPSTEEIQYAQLKTLQAWASEGRRRWILADRCLTARVWHHEMFCEGGDAGHLQFVDYLKGEKLRMEQLSKVLDQAAYKLIVAQQEAEWLQSERREPTACADVEQDKCDREDQEEASCKSDTAKLRCASKSKKKQKKKASGRVLQPTRATTTTTAPSSPAQAKDCVLEDSDKEEQELRRHLNSFLDHHRFLPASPRFQNQRLLIIEQLFRHLIAFEPVLLVRSQSHDSVHSFLNSESELSMKELRLLAGLLKYAPSGKIDLDLIHQCILAALYGVPPEVKSVKLLGGSVNRKPLSSSLGPEGWCHLYHFNGCAGCGKRAANSFEEVSWVMQEMRPQGVLSRWTGPSPATPVGLQLQEHGLAVVAACNPTTHLERVKNASGSGARRPVFVERQHRCFVFLRTRPGPHADAFVNNLRGLGDQCLIVTREGNKDKFKGAEGLSSADLWTTRIRSGSKAERACQKWSVEASLVLKTTFDYLISNYAEGRHRPKAFDDVLNILILNSREGYKNCEAFLSSIAQQLPSDKPVQDDGLQQLDHTSQELQLFTGGDQSVLLTRALFT